MKGVIHMTDFEKGKTKQLIKYYGGVFLGSFILGRLMKKSFESGAQYGIYYVGTELEKAAEECSKEESE